MKEEDVEEGQYLRAPNSAEEKKRAISVQRGGGELNGHQWPGSEAGLIGPNIRLCTRMDHLPSNLKRL